MLQLLQCCSSKKEDNMAQVEINKQARPKVKVRLIQT